MEPENVYNFVFSCPLCGRKIFIILPDADATVGCGTEVPETDANNRRVEAALDIHVRGSHLADSEDGPNDPG